MAGSSCPRASRHVLRLRGRIGSGHQGVRPCGGLHRHHLAESPADVHVHQVTSAGLCPEAGREVHSRRLLRSVGFSWDAAFRPFRAASRTTTWASSRSSTVTSRITSRTSPKRPRRYSMPCFPACRWVRRQPRWRRTLDAFYEWALENNHPPIGFYSAYPGLGVQDIRALLADASESPSASSG